MRHLNVTSISYEHMKSAAEINYKKNIEFLSISIFSFYVFVNLLEVKGGDDSGTVFKF